MAEHVKALQSHGTEIQSTLFRPSAQNGLPCFGSSPPPSVLPESSSSSANRTQSPCALASAALHKELFQAHRTTNFNFYLPPTKRISLLQAPSIQNDAQILDLDHVVTCLHVSPHFSSVEVRYNASASDALHVRRIVALDFLCAGDQFRVRIALTPANLPAFVLAQAPSLPTSYSMSCFGQERLFLRLTEHLQTAQQHFCQSAPHLALMLFVLWLQNYRDDFFSVRCEQCSKCLCLPAGHERLKDLLMPPLARDFFTGAPFHLPCYHGSCPSLEKSGSL